MTNAALILFISFAILPAVFATEDELYSEFVELINVMRENGTIEARQIFIEMTANWEAYKAFRNHLDTPAKKVLMLQEGTLAVAGGFPTEIRKKIEYLRKELKEPNLIEPSNITLPKVEEAVEDIKHKEDVNKTM